MAVSVCGIRDQVTMIWVGNTNYHMLAPLLGQPGIGEVSLVKRLKPAMDRRERVDRMRTVAHMKLSLWGPSIR